MSLMNRVDLTEAEAEASLEFLLNGADQALISAFLVLLRAKGETSEEVSFLFLLENVHRLILKIIEFHTHTRVYEVVFL